MIPFFQKYNAVRADDTGPQWSKAGEPQLIAWLVQYHSLANGWNDAAKRDATPAERQAALPIYHEIAAEVATRANRPDASPEILAAYHVRVATP